MLGSSFSLYHCCLGLHHECQTICQGSAAKSGYLSGFSVNLRGLSKLATCQQLQNQPLERWLLRKWLKLYSFNPPLFIYPISSHLHIMKRGTDSTPHSPGTSTFTHESLFLSITFCQNPTHPQGLAEIIATGGIMILLLPSVFFLAFSLTR